MGSTNRKKKINVSTAKINKIIDRRIDNKNDLTIIPATIEKRTSPLLYSFFRGRKKVLRKTGTERRFATYLLNPTKNSKRLPKKSLYQNAIR